MSKYEPISRGAAKALWMEKDPRVRCRYPGHEWGPVNNPHSFDEPTLECALELPDPNPVRVVVEDMWLFGCTSGQGADLDRHIKNAGGFHEGALLTVVVQSTADYKNEERVLREWWESWHGIKPTHVTPCNVALYDLLDKRFGTEASR